MRPRFQIRRRLLQALSSGLMIAALTAGSALPALAVLSQQTPFQGTLSPGELTLAGSSDKDKPKNGGCTAQCGEEDSVTCETLNVSSCIANKDNGCEAYNEKGELIVQKECPKVIFGPGKKGPAKPKE